VSQEAIQLLSDIRDHLRSIDASMSELVRQKRAEAPKPVASDRDLNGQYGNPVLKFNPRDWNGPSFKNRRFSECPPDLLDMVASTFDWFAEQADQKHEKASNGKPVSEYKRADAARARGWALRIRTGKHVQQAETTGSVGGWSGDDDGAGDDESTQSGWSGGF
jgi:hypothetical protein